MEKVTTIGLNIAKSVFQVHGIDATGEVVVRRLLRCMIGIEACNTSHHWARELLALGPSRKLTLQSPEHEPPPAHVRQVSTRTVH